MTAIAWLEEAGASDARPEPRHGRAPRASASPRWRPPIASSAPTASRGRASKTALDLLTVLLEAAAEPQFHHRGSGRHHLTPPVGRCVSFCAIFDAIGGLSWRANTNLVIHIAHGVPKPVADRLAEIARFERTLIDALEPDLLAAPPTGVTVNLRRSRAGPPRPGAERAPARPGGAPVARARHGRTPRSPTRDAAAGTAAGRPGTHSPDASRRHGRTAGSVEQAASRREPTGEGADPSPREGRAGRGSSGSRRADRALRSAGGRISTSAPASRG